MQSTSTSPTEQTSVRAIDVGFGNVKFTVHHRCITDQVQCDTFPSHSPMATGKGLAVGGLKARNTVTVNVGGIDYEVGKQVGLVLGVNEESVVLGRDFCLSDAYLARLRGALYYMRETDKEGNPYTPPTIELLVVGLPVSVYNDKGLIEKMRARLIGLHELPDGRSTTVERVMVLAQPMGAFFQYGLDSRLIASMQNQVNLIIDPGYHTFDWLLSSGLIPMDGRSDSVNRGVSAILAIMASEINSKEFPDLGEKDTTIVRMLDEHYRTGNPFRPFQTNVDLTKYEACGKPVVD